MFEVITGELRAKLLIAHVGPLMRAWAAPPTLHIAGLRTIERVRARNSGFAYERAHRDRHRIRQRAVPFTHNRRFWALFAQWVCTLVATPPQTTPAPPPIGGNCTTRASPGHHTAQARAANRGELRHPRLRHAGDTPQEGFAWRKTPIATNLKCAASPPRPAQGRLARKNSPKTAPPAALPRKNSPGTAPPAALPRKNSPSMHKNAEFGPI